MFFYCFKIIMLRLFFKILLNFHMIKNYEIDKGDLVLSTFLLNKAKKLKESYSTKKKG